MSKYRILILGGNGFIGSNLADYFSKQGHRVTVFDLEKPKTQIDGVKYVEGNFFDDELLEQIISEKDIIIHSISTINPGNSNIKFLQGYQKDLTQTVKLCSSLVGTQTKLIFLSSGGTIYGNQAIFPISETALPNPINHYGSLKVCIETILRTFNAQFKTHFYIARIANPYGPGQDYLKGVGFIDAALKKALDNETIEIWGNGETIRDYVYIDDVCGMIHALCNYSGAIDTFNISSGIGSSQNEIIEILKHLGLDPKVSYKQVRSVDVDKIQLSNDLIRSIYKGEITDLFNGIRKYLKYLHR